MNNLLELYKTKYVNDVICSRDDNRKLTLFKYKNLGINFADDYLRAARGIVLDNNGNIIQRGFDKFFGYKQLDNQSTYSENFKKERANANTITNITEKLDGTLILVTINQMNGELLISTTGSLNNKYIDEATKFFINYNKSYINFLKDNNDKTFAFEYIAPTNRIAVKYTKPDFVFLNTIEKSTGKLLGKQNYNLFNFSEAQNYNNLSLKNVINYQKELENFEGFIATNEYNNLIKFKTIWWFENSKIFSIFNNDEITKRKIKIVVDSLTSDTLDDLMSARNEFDPNEKAIQTIIDYTLRLSEQLQKEYYTVINNKLSNKEIGLNYNALYRGYIFAKINNKPVNNIFYSELEKLLMGQ